MKITNIDVYSANPERIINFNFRDPTSQNPYIVKQIIGLDADEITPKFYGVSLLSKDKYYDLSSKKRELVILLGLNPDFSTGKSYSDLRDDIYRFVSASRTGAVQLRFKNGTVVKAAISGFITKVEAPVFTKTQEAQITISCRDSMLLGLDEVNVDISSLDPTLTTITDDESTAPHGMRFGIKFSTNVINFLIKDAVDPTWKFEVNLTGSPLVQFQNNDVLHLSSEFNNKHLYLVRGASTSQLADRIISNSIWPIIFPGENTFVCPPNVTWEYILYYPTYWGV